MADNESVNEPANERVLKIRENLLHQFMGVETIDSSEGRGFLAFTVNRNVINPAGLLHGGALYTLCDVCAYAGLMSILEPDREAVTHDLHISVMRAAKAGDRVTIESRIVRMGASLCFVDVTAAVSDKVIATARVTKSMVDLKMD